MNHAASGPPLAVEAARPNLVLFNVGLGTLLTAMAGSSISLALPSIQSEFGLDTGAASWVMLSFLLCTTSLMLVVGRGADIVGHRRFYLLGFLLFGAASLFAGLAVSYWMLIGSRVLQGVGGAMVMAAGPALLTTTFPGRQRGKALGLLATATYVGLTAGPPLGGLLLSHGGWHWVFLINVPIAALIFGLGLKLLPAAARNGSSRFDVPGAFTLIMGLPLLLLAMNQAQRQGWGSPLTIGMMATGAALLIGFVGIERRSAAPLVRPGLFGSAAFSGSVVAALCNYIAIFVPTFLLPFYLTEALGIEPSNQGLLLSAQPLVMALVASPAGALSDRIGSRGLAAVGMMILAAGLWQLSLLGPGASQQAVALGLLTMGLGTGIFISPNSSSLMGAAPRDQQGVAGSVLALSRSLGMMIGVALGAGLFTAFGGHTGRAWEPADFHAFAVALLIAAAVAVVGALASWGRGGGEKNIIV